jgi:hypothetical protein
LLKVIEACAQEANLLTLRQLASRIAGEKQQQAAAAVASVRYSRLMLSLVGRLQALRWHESLDEVALGALAEPLEKQATQLVSSPREAAQERQTSGTGHARGASSGANCGQEGALCGGILPVRNGGQRILHERIPLGLPSCGSSLDRWSRPEGGGSAHC